MHGYWLTRMLKFGEERQIKKIIVICGVIIAISLIFSIIFFIKDFLVEKKWYKTDAVVVNYNISNPKNIWTKLKYNYKNDYTVTINEHSYYMSVNSKVPIYVNMNNPTVIRLEKSLYIISEIAFIFGMIFTGILIIFILPVYILAKKKVNKVEKIKNGSYIKIKIFNNEKMVKVFCSGDSMFDDNGNYKQDDYYLNKKELSCLNWFLNNIDINNYRKEIVDYCNKQYSLYSDIQISDKDLEQEINIHSVAINVTKTWKSKDGFVYPEISFYGECKCDEEHGICIGFRDKKFLGIHAQDWTL